MTPATARPLPSGTPLVLFFHGNSFPASTYQVMLNELRRRGLQVYTLEKIGHNPAYPVTSNWPHLVEEVHAFAQPLVNAHQGPVVLVGHSLGGMLSLMLAALYPDLAHAVVMVDAPAVAGWQANLLHLSKKLSFTAKYSPGAVSKKRRHQWGSLDEVRQHFASKKNFARWHPGVLEDYVQHGTREVMVDGQVRRELSFSREIETLIYNTVPHHLESLIKRHPLKCPISLVAARHSREMKLAGIEFTKRITKGRITIIDGTHLVPMESPLATAAAVEAAILNMLGPVVAKN
ncbi:MAG: alpha/beta hydrolase [Betaproteobacteria bacterium]|nr:alpha/beta hydrolase [Betaproteobacteria bacterium]